jgi:uroporphyrinogen-III synthase
VTPGRPPRVLITRAPHQASELADRLRALGLDPILIPAIELADPTSYAALDHALTHLDTFHWLLFTSANAVEAFHRRAQHDNSVILSEASQPHREAQSKDLPTRPHPPLPLDPPAAQVPARNLYPEMTLSNANREHPKIAAIGPATARALQSIGLTPDLIPPQAIAESLTAALLPHALQSPTHPGQASPTRFLLVRAEDARDLLPDTLRSAGADVTIAPAYRTLIPAGSIPAIRALFAPAQPPPDAITFTSSSTARNLLALCEAAGVTLPPATLRVSIGPITTATLRELGYPPHVEAPSASIEALAQAVYDCLAPEPGA